MRRFIDMPAGHLRVRAIAVQANGHLRDEDEFGSASVAAELPEARYRTERRETRNLIDCWRNAPVEACAGGQSAEYLQRSAQLAALEFVLSRIDDPNAVFASADDELRRLAR